MIISDLPPSDPMIVQVIRAQQAAVAAADNIQLSIMADRWLQAERALTAQMQVLSYEVAEMAKEGIVDTAAVMRLERYHSLVTQAQLETDKYIAYADSSISAQQRILLNRGLDDVAEQLRIAYQGTELGISFSLLPTDALNAMIGMAGDGSPLATLLAGISKDALVGMSEALLDGIALGLPPLTTAKRMADGFGIGLSRALTISRTETLRAYRYASQQQYTESGVVEGYIRIAQHTPTTCAGCLFAEGQIFPTDRTFDAHPNCRCSTIPIVEGVAPPEFEKGEAWFERQSEDVQRGILGPGRYDAWQSGTPLSAMTTHISNETWGGAFVPTLVKDLETTE